MCTISHEIARGFAEISYICTEILKYYSRLGESAWAGEVFV